jgi:hypothetical protein
MMDATKQGWIDKTHEAIFSVERYLGIKGDSEQVKNFSMLANWIYETKIDPLTFMPTGFELAKDSAQTFATFLHSLHHSMHGNWNLLFIEIQGGGSYMIQDVEPTDLTKISAVNERRSRTLDRPYEIHEDVARFIKHLNLYANTGDLPQAVPEAETA